MFNYERLKECICESGKTKTYLCKKLGRPQYYLRDVLKNENAIPDNLQVVLAEELGTTVAYLNNESDIKEQPIRFTDEPEDEETIELREIWESIDQEDRSFLITTARMLKARRNNKL